MLKLIIMRTNHYRSMNGYIVNRLAMGIGICVIRQFFHG